MIEDHTRTLWFGIWGGLAAYDGKRFRAFTTMGGLPQNVVIALAEDQQCGLWIGTEGGLAYFKDGRFRIFTTHDGLPSDVTADLSDRSARLWVGSEPGFARLTGSNRFERVNELHAAWRMLGVMPGVLALMAVYARSRRLIPLIFADWMMDLIAVITTLSS